MNQPSGVGLGSSRAHHEGVTQTPDDAANQPQPHPQPLDPPTQPLDPTATAPQAPLPPPPPGYVPPQGQTPPPGPGAPPGHGPRQWWRRATATPGRRLATGLAAALAVLGMLGVLTLGAFAVGAVAFGRGGHGIERGHGDSPMGDMRGRMGEGMGRQGGDGQGRSGQAWPKQDGQSAPNRDGWGPGQVGPMGGTGRMGGLGSALHGEVTVDQAGTPKVVLFQSGEVTSVSSTSLAVKSSDGFTATYALSSTTRIMPSQPAAGATVWVLANKDGAAATRVMVLNPGTAATS